MMVLKRWRLLSLDPLNPLALPKLWLKRAISTTRSSTSFTSVLASDSSLSTSNLFSTLTKRNGLISARRLIWVVFWTPFLRSTSANSLLTYLPQPCVNISYQSWCQSSTLTVTTRRKRPKLSRNLSISMLLEIPCTSTARRLNRNSFPTSNSLSYSFGSPTANKDFNSLKRSSPKKVLSISKEWDKSWLNLPKRLWRH